MRAQKRNPKAKAMNEAKKVGTKRAASEEGPGAGASASAAATFSMATRAIIIKATIKNFTFIASIANY